MKILVPTISFVVVVLIVLIAIGFGASIYYDVKVQNSSGEELKNICTNSFFSTAKVQNIPVRCLKFYQK